MGRPEITDPKGRACGFPSLRNLGQPDTFPQSPHRHCCEPDREHFSVIDPQISKFQRLHTLGPTSPTPQCLPVPRAGQLEFGLPGPLRFLQTLRRLWRPSFPSPVSGGGNWVGMERRGMGIQSEAPPAGGAKISCLKNRTWA